MTKIYQSFTCLFLCCVLMLSSCGYVSDKPVMNQGLYKSDELQTCKIDVSKLGEIFKADQKEQIRCLQENFIQFTKYVRSRNQGSVTESELNAFVRKFFEGQSDSIVKGLSLIFQLNMLLLRDEADRISHTNISPLFELLVQVNKEAIEITSTLKEMDDENNQGRFWELRERFNNSVKRFTDFTLKLIEKSPDIKQQLNIKSFILDASKKLGNKDIDQSTIDSLIFLKRILVAGDKEIITSFELAQLIKKLPSLLSLSFDLYYVKGTNFDSEKDHMRFYYNNLMDLYKIIEFNQQDFDLFSIDQVIKLAQDFLKSRNTQLEVSKFKKSIVALKTKFIKGSPENFSKNDLKSLLDLVKDLVERNYFNYITYNALSQTIESNSPISSLPQLNLPDDYDLFSKIRLTELQKDFQNIAVNIRYYRNSKTNVASYGYNFYRNKSGFMEASLLQWGVRKLLENYGHKNALGISQVNVKEFNNFLNDMQPLLEEFKLWSPTPETFAQNAVLLADLFQNQSNGDLEVNETEAIEYVQMILSAVEINDKFRTELTNQCPLVTRKMETGFEVNCFNEHFFETFLNRLPYRKNFPALSNYVANTSVDEIYNYLAGVEGFARDINTPEIPIHKRDNILILGAMINIESTMIRFDYNKDGVIDNKTCVIPNPDNSKKCLKTELEVAFEVYKKAIISIGDLDESTIGYAYSIFLYLVKYKEKPPKGGFINNAKFLYFHWFESNGLIEAKRLNIGRILYYLVLENGNTAKFLPANGHSKGKGLL